MFNLTRTFGHPMRIGAERRQLGASGTLAVLQRHGNGTYWRTVWAPGQGCILNVLIPRAVAWELIEAGDN